MRLHDLNVDGTVANYEELLRAHGFKVGSAVMRKKDKLTGIIEEIAAEHVKVKSDVSIVVSITAFMSHEWVVQAAKKDVVEIADWYTHVPTASIDLAKHMLRGKVAEGLDKLCRKYAKVWSSLSVFPTKPISLKAKEVIEDGELVLVPITFNINVYKSDDGAGKKINDKTVFLGDDFKPRAGSKTQFSITLAASNNLPKEDDDKDKESGNKDFFFNPFWHILHTDVAAEANLSLRWESDKGIKYPVFYNNRELKAGEELKYTKGTFPCKADQPKRDAPAPAPSSSAKKHKK
jgi:hypothetical protein